MLFFFFVSVESSVFLLWVFILVCRFLNEYDNVGGLIVGR